MGVSQWSKSGIKSQQKRTLCWPSSRNVLPLICQREDIHTLWTALLVAVLGLAWTHASIPRSLCDQRQVSEGRVVRSRMPAETVIEFAFYPSDTESCAAGTLSVKCTGFSGTPTEFMSVIWILISFLVLSYFATYIFPLSSSFLSNIKLIFSWHIVCIITLANIPEILFKLSSGVHSFIKYLLSDRYY